MHYEIRRNPQSSLGHHRLFARWAQAEFTLGFHCFTDFSSVSVERENCSVPRFWCRWRASLERAWGRLWLLKSLKLNRRAQLLFHQSHECSRDQYSLYRYRYQNQTLEVGYCCNYEFQPIVNPCLTLTSHQLPLSTQHTPPSLLTLNGAQYNKLCPDLLLSWNFQDTFFYCSCHFLFWSNLYD